MDCKGLLVCDSLWGYFRQPQPRPALLPEFKAHSALGTVRTAANLAMGITVMRCLYGLWFQEVRLYHTAHELFQDSKKK